METLRPSSALMRGWPGMPRSIPDAVVFLPGRIEFDAGLER